MYREVTLIEVREVLRLAGVGLAKKRIAAQFGLDPNRPALSHRGSDGAGPRDGDGHR